jgi:hypothetical protein
MDSGARNNAGLALCGIRTGQLNVIWRTGAERGDGHQVRPKKKTCDMIAGLLYLAPEVGLEPTTP